jgi:hypothetical protein
MQLATPARMKRPRTSKANAWLTVALAPLMACSTPPSDASSPSSNDSGADSVSYAIDGASSLEAGVTDSAGLRDSVLTNADAATDAAVSGDAAGCSMGPLLVPSCGVLTGLASNAPGGVKGRETEIGHHVDLVHLYKVTFTDPFPTAADLTALGNDTALLVDWDTKSNGGTTPMSWSAIAGGASDSAIDAEAALLKAYAKPIMVALMHEMELANSGGAYGTPADFVSMWQHVVSRMRADGAGNVIWVWDMGGERATNATPYYPGGAYVDWIAWDPYNWGDCSRNPSGWRTFSQIVSQNYDYFTTTTPYDTKPLMLAEWGSIEQTGNANGKRDWFEAVPSEAAAFPQLKALVYFDYTGTCDWSVSSTPVALTGFEQMAAAGY